MMLELPGKDINPRQLNDELAALGLPGFTGAARLSREVDEFGNVVVEDGVPKKVPPYILVKSDPLTTEQEAAAAAVVEAHVPVAEPPQPDPQAELDAAIAAAATLDELKAALLGMAGKSGRVAGRPA
jgi:hypothetical protein